MAHPKPAKMARPADTADVPAKPTPQQAPAARDDSARKPSKGGGKSDSRKKQR